MYVASSGFNYYPSKDTYGDGWKRDYYLRTMFTCSNLDCDYYDRFLCRRHVLFIRAFHYKPVCPACSSEVLHTRYWDPTNYRRVFVNGRINREVLPTQDNSNHEDKNRVSRMIQTLDLSKRLNLKTSSDDFTLALTTIAFEYNLEVDLEDLRKIYIINSVIDECITTWYNNLRKLIEVKPRISYLDSFAFDLEDKISGFMNEISDLKGKIPFSYNHRELASDLKDKISGFMNEISDLKDKMPSYQSSRREWMSGLEDKLAYYSYYYNNFPDDNPFFYFDELISEIKKSLSDCRLSAASPYYNSISIDKIAKRLSPHLIDPTSLPKFISDSDFFR